MNDTTCHFNAGMQVSSILKYKSHKLLQLLKLISSWHNYRNEKRISINHEVSRS